MSLISPGSLAAWCAVVLMGLAPLAPAAALADSAADAAAALRDAELRRAVADAERAEWLARIPPTSGKPLTGSADTGHAGVVALMRSVDLAGQLARELCAALPSGRRVALYDPVSSEGIVTARSVDDALLHLAEQLGRANLQLQQLIDRYTPPASRRAVAPVALAVIPATIQSAADIAALFRSDVTLTGVAYGDGARALFASALFKACPQHIAGLGAGYLGELDPRVHGALRARVRNLAALRGSYANRIAVAEG